MEELKKKKNDSLEQFKWFLCFVALVGIITQKNTEQRMLSFVSAACDVT